LSTTGIEIEHFLQTHAGSVCQPDRGRPLTNEARPMEAPLEITFEGVSHSETIEALIRKEAKKLDQMDEHITSARVVVAQPQNRHYTGDPNRIRIRLKVLRGADINVNHDPGAGKRYDDMEVAIHNAFSTALRHLEDAVRKRQDHVEGS
jgi:ribosome-associated translation inhibitor RaiA